MSDAKIRERIKPGGFPIHVSADDWASGEINWLFYVIASGKEATASVIANFGQVAEEGDLRMHPITARFVDEDALEKMGAKKGAQVAAN